MGIPETNRSNSGLRADAAESRTSVKPEPMHGRRTIQSLERAIDLLELLASAGAGLGLKEIAEKSRLNASTCHHLLATLAKRGLVGRASSRNYVLGPRIAHLSESRLKHFSFADAALPELRELNEVTKESVQLAAMQGKSLATLAKLDSMLPVRVGFGDEYSRSDAAHATATGKAILAWLPDSEMARIVGTDPLRRFTEKTVPSRKELREELRLVRRNGCSCENEEFQLGVVCVGGAVRDQSGAVVGSIGVSMPRMRAKGDHLEAVKQHVKEASRRISAICGI